MPPQKTSTDVLIAGGGPVGLALAVELGTRGIRTVLVERFARTGQQPRAKTTNIRSMEHMRRWGLADAVRARAPLPASHPRDIQFATRLFGHKIARIEHALFMSPPRDERYAEPSQWIPQYAIEDILRAHAETLPSVSLRFGITLDSATQSDSHVDVALLDAGAGSQEHVTAQFLVGADGARSKVRDVIGAQLTGDHGFASFLGLVVKAPGLGNAVPLGPALMYLLVNPDGIAMMGPMDRDDLWFWMQPTQSNAPIDMVEARRRFALSLGQDFDFQILTMDPWLAHRLIADKYRRGRIFLAGDACHLHPPFGGYGMNMGLGDAVDIGWKLAAALQGWGGPLLLNSYEAERRPVHQRTIDEAVENLGFFGRHFQRGVLEEATPEGNAARAALAPDILAAKTREFRALGMVLGHTYVGSPITIEDQKMSAPVFDNMNYVPSSRAGARAPHAWLGEERSLYDAFGAWFTLLDLDPKGGGETNAMRAAAKSVGMPLSIVELDDKRLRDLYGSRFALIRPDQHIAWCGNHLDSAEALKIASIACGHIRFTA